MDNPPPNSLEEKLDEILATLKKIEKQNYKNPWTSGTKFVILNFTKIAVSILTLFLLWKIWGIVDGISGGVDFLLAKISDLKFW